MQHSESIALRGLFSIQRQLDVKFAAVRLRDPEADCRPRLVLEHLS